MKLTNIFLRNIFIVFFLILIHFGYAQKKISIAYPVLPQLPVIPYFTCNVTDFGAKPDDGKDDTKAIQDAINTISGKGGGRIIFPDGVYDISIQGDGSKTPNYALQIACKVALEAQNSRKATLRLADNQPGFAAIIQWKPSGNADDVRITGLVVDANSTNNKPSVYDDFKYMEAGKVIRWLPRIVLSSRNGKRVLVDDVHFTNLLNINTINIGVHTNSTGEQLEKVSDITISNCLFDNIGWQKFDFDHSTIYTQGNRFAIKNNVFKSINGAGTLSARCPIEIHGSDQTITNNNVNGFTMGINVTGAHLVSHRQLIENNRFLDVARGIYLWSWAILPKINDAGSNVSMLSDVVIRKNMVRIAPDAWLSSAVPSRKHMKGIGTNPFVSSASSIENLLIEENTIITSGYAKAVDSYELQPIESAIGFHKNPMKNIYVINNVVGRNLGPSIAGDSDIEGLFIDKNKLLEPEMANLSQVNERAAILFTGEIKNAVITNNTIKDTETPNNIEKGIIIKKACIGNCKIEGNTIEPSTIPLQ